MPELPEVESVRRIMERVLKGRRIAKAEVVPDDIMQFGQNPLTIQEALEGKLVTAVGRHGKYWWLELEEKPWLYGHLGMSGWIRELGAPTMRLKEHGNAPLDDETGRPRFLKLLLETEEGGRIAFTDGRRLGRMWLSSDPTQDDRLTKLGPDAYTALPELDALIAILKKRKAPLKALLLDQGIFAGVGNWIADETLYHARLSPKRLGSSLTPKEVTQLRKALVDVLDHAVRVDADYEQFPENWLFHHRWGGSKGTEFIDGKQIVREPVGGRTTAWVPEIQL